MAVPDFQTLMFPILKRAGATQECSVDDLRRAMVNEFSLSDAEVQELLPSGRQTRFSNRVYWARWYLIRAGLLESPRRGIARLTEQGRELLARGVTRVDLALLSGLGNVRSDSVDADDALPSPSADSRTPEEQIEAAHKLMRAEVTGELLDHVKTLSPAAFEHLVLALLKALGYGGLEGPEHLGRAGDGGVDGRIQEDTLGLEEVYVQAKHWTNTVGRPDVQAFAGSLEGFRARKGIFITTSTFSSEAYEFATRIERRIVLIGGRRLTDLMYDAGVGVTTRDTIPLKTVDTDFFSDEE